MKSEEDIRSTAEVHEKYAHLISTSPGFIQRFFASSRLHHLSTWRTDLSDYVIRHMSASYSGGVKNRYRVSKPDESHRVIMHIDMDCFFASVSTRDRPHLQSLPIAIAHATVSLNADTSSSEIASCNYVARARGIKNGMFLGGAKQLCPELLVLPYEFHKYDEVSKQLYDILLSKADFVQAVSCDEVYVDVTFVIQKLLQPQPVDSVTGGSERLISAPKPGHSQSHKRRFNATRWGMVGHDGNNDDDDDDEDEEEAFARQRMRLTSTMMPHRPSNLSSLSRSATAAAAAANVFNRPRALSGRDVEQAAVALANELRAQIFAQTRCHASIGISHNPLLARIATARAKPNGTYFLRAAEALPLLSELSLKDLPGIGWSTAEKCVEIGLQRCADIHRWEETYRAETNVTALAALQRALGDKAGQTVFDCAHGVDLRQLENKARQSVGADINWGVRFRTQSEVGTFLADFAAEVFSRLFALDLTAGHVTLDIKKKLYQGEPTKFLGCGHCLDLSKSLALPTHGSHALRDARGLSEMVTALFAEMHVAPEDVRGVGIHLRKLQKKSCDKATGMKAYLQSMAAKQRTVSEEVHEGKQEERQDDDDDDDDSTIPVDDAESMNESIQRMVTANNSGSGSGSGSGNGSGSSSESGHRESNKVEDRSDCAADCDEKYIIEEREGPRHTSLWWDDDQDDHPGSVIQTRQSLPQSQLVADERTQLDIELLDEAGNPPVVSTSASSSTSAALSKIAASPQGSSQARLSSPKPTNSNGKITSFFSKPTGNVDRMLTASERLLAQQWEHILKLPGGRAALHSVDRQFLSALPVDVLRDQLQQLREEALRSRSKA